MRCSGGGISSRPNLEKKLRPKIECPAFLEDHDYILVYARNGATGLRIPCPGETSRTKPIRIRTATPVDRWKTSDLSARNPYQPWDLQVRCPSGASLMDRQKDAIGRSQRKNCSIWTGTTNLVGEGRQLDSSTQAIPV